MDHLGPERSLDAPEDTPNGVDFIRDALLDELHDLEALQRRASTVWEDYRDQLAAHPDAIAIPQADIADGRTRVACGSGLRIGFSVVLAVRDGICELDGLFVEPELWRRGVGRALIDDVVATAVSAGASRLEVTGNPRAVAFYEAVGFHRIGLTPTRFGPGVRMQRTL